MERQVSSKLALGRYVCPKFVVERYVFSKIAVRRYVCPKIAAKRHVSSEIDSDYYTVFINKVKIHCVTDIGNSNKVVMYNIKNAFKLTLRFRYSRFKCKYNFIRVGEMYLFICMNSRN